MGDAVAQIRRDAGRRVSEFSGLCRYEDDSVGAVCSVD